MKKIGYITYSLPFKWWDTTNIAHNKIWSWLVMALAKQGGYEQYVLHSKLDFMTESSCAKYNCLKKKDKKVDVLVMFCGPHLPVTSTDCITYESIQQICQHNGKVVFVTCDYQLQMESNVKRFGPLASKGKDEDALMKDKEWVFVFHAPLPHHFATRKRRDNFKERWNDPKVLSVPLNMSGIAPDWKEQYPICEKPAFDMLYCGAFRSERVEHFKRYFCCNPAKNWVISTTREEKFRALPGFKATTRGPLPGSLWKMLNRSWVQLIISDDKGTDDTPLPTRYWESVSAGSPVLCDLKCCSEWDFSNILCGPRFVDGPKSLAHKIECYKENPTIRENVIKKQRKDIIGFDPYVAWKIERWFS